MKDVVVIGAGVGGLATAVRMAAQGHRVTVLEAGDSVGGKLAEHRDAGHRFDRGPSLFTMPELMEELDRLVPEGPGRPPQFAYRTLDRSTHYFWEGESEPLVAWTDNGRFAEEVEARWGSPAKGLLSHLASSRDAFELTRGVFLERSLHDIKTYVSSAAWKLLGRVWKLPLLGTLHTHNARQFKEPKLQQLFNRYATYNGSDPYRAPAMMHLGVVILTGCAADRIVHDGHRVTGVKDAKGNTHHADLVVSNADLHPTYRRLLPDLSAPERILSQERSTSGIIFYWGVRGHHPKLGLHNILFSEDYKTEFQHIREQGTPGPDPTVYINITSKELPNDAPEGHENWFVLMNVKANPDQWTDEAVAVLKEQVLDKVERTLGTRPDIVCEQVLRPQDIEGLTGSWRGALYGASSNSAAAAFLRHRNQSSQLEGLYFCGGSVHPGGGIPLCLLGAKIVDELAHAS